MIQTYQPEYKQKTVLILDNIENLPQPILKFVLEPLLKYSTKNLHIVLSTQNINHLQISALKVQGHVNEISSQDLKFTPFEIQDFFDAALDRSSFLKINEKSLGWAVILRLIKNKLSREQEPDKIIKKYTGQEEATAEYINEHILTPLSAPQREMLFDASILKEFSGDILDEIRGKNENNHLISTLNFLSPLLNKTNPDNNYYQFHPIFHDAISYYHKLNFPQKRQKIHLRASKYFFKEGHLIESIRHALKGGRPDFAAENLEKAGGILLWNREGMTRIRKAHSLIPEETLINYPRLYLLKALVLLKDGQLNEAQHIYQKISKNIALGEFDKSAELEYDLAVISSTLSIYKGTTLKKETTDQLTKTLKKFEREDKTQIGFLYTILCLKNFQKGDLKEAKRIAAVAISYFQKQKQLFGEVYIYLHLSTIAISEGDLEGCFEYLEKTQGFRRRYFMDDKDMLLILNVILAEYYYEINDLPRAQRLLGDINRRLETGEAWYEIYAGGYHSSSSIAFLQKGLNASNSLHNEATIYIRREGLKRLNRLLIAQKIDFLCRSGKISKARELVQQHNLTMEEYDRSQGVRFSVREYYGVSQSLVRLLIAEERYQEAIKQLEQQCAILKNTDEIRTKEKLTLLLAIAYFGAGKIQKSVKILKKCLIFARRTGFLRLYLDEKVFLLPLLKHYCALPKVCEKDHAKYLLQLLEAPLTPQKEIKLSRRENQVLIELAEGHADKILARNLEITENTVRFHIKNLFKKLGVNSRLKVVSQSLKNKFL